MGRRLSVRIDAYEVTSSGLLIEILDVGRARQVRCWGDRHAGRDAVREERVIGSDVTHVKRLDVIFRAIYKDFEAEPQWFNGELGSCICGACIRRTRGRIAYQVFDAGSETVLCGRMSAARPREARPE